MLCCSCGCAGSSGSKEPGAKKRKNRTVLLEEVLVYASLKWLRNLECKQWNKLVMYFMWYFFTKSVAWSCRVIFNVLWEWTRLGKLVQGLKVSLAFKNCSFTEWFFVFWCGRAQSIWTQNTSNYAWTKAILLLKRHKPKRCVVSHASQMLKQNPLSTLH